MSSDKSQASGKATAALRRPALSDLEMESGYKNRHLDRSKVTHSSPAAAAHRGAAFEHPSQREAAGPCSNGGRLCGLWPLSSACRAHSYQPVMTAKVIQNFKEERGGGSSKVNEEGVFCLCPFPTGSSPCAFSPLWDMAALPWHWTFGFPAHGFHRAFPDLADPLSYSCQRKHFGVSCTGLTPTACPWGATLYIGRHPCMACSKGH